MKKILIVDDDFFDKKTPRGKQIFEAVEAEGIHIDGINNAAKAVELLRTANYDIILMDGEFEGQILQGPGAVAKIREVSSVPIIMISGSKSLNREGITRGANDFFDDKQYICDDIKNDNGKIAMLLCDGKKSQSHLSAYDCAKLRAKISQTLLSLDITLQALAIIHDEQPDKTKNFLEDFYNEDVDHYKKLDKLIALADQYGITKLRKLSCAKSIEKFFNKLVEHTMDAESLLSHDWQLEGIKSFSDWFAATLDSLV